MDVPSPWVSLSSPMTRTQWYQTKSSLKVIVSRYKQVPSAYPQGISQYMVSTGSSSSVATSYCGQQLLKPETNVQFLSYFLQKGKYFLFHSRRLAATKVCHLIPEGLYKRKKQRRKRNKQKQPKASQDASSGGIIQKAQWWPAGELPGPGHLLSSSCWFPGSASLRSCLPFCWQENWGLANFNDWDLIVSSKCAAPYAPHCDMLTWYTGWKLRHRQAEKKSIQEDDIHVGVAV